MVEYMGKRGRRFHGYSSPTTSHSNPSCIWGKTLLFKKSWVGSTGRRHWTNSPNSRAMRDTEERQKVTMCYDFFVPHFTWEALGSTGSSLRFYCISLELVTLAPYFEALLVNVLGSAKHNHSAFLFLLLSFRTDAPFRAKYVFPF